jgi:2,3-bisphosphoglycerate-independent phosphoglycerate mutase
MKKKPIVLMILDGYGMSANKEHNAIAEAATPVVDELMATCPYVQGNASGLAVGLPEGQMGNSEVGHLNMGAGRIIYQELTHISKEIKEGGFFQNPEMLAAVNRCKERGSALHLYGLVSDGGVHSHNTHIYGLLELAKRNNLDKVFVHCFLDGRDTPPASGKHYVELLEAEMKKIGVGAVATVQGRYYAMDRDNNYERTKIAYDALTKGEGVKADSAPAAIQASYDIHETDEFMKPAIIMKDGQPVATIGNGDAIIFYNFRPDRARQITRAFCDDDFTRFERGPRLDVA